VVRKGKPDAASRQKDHEDAADVFAREYKKRMRIIMETNIYLIRHGQTVWNMEKRFQGQSDTALDESGEDQARLLMERMREIPIDLIVSSDLIRARRTAEILAESRGLKVTEDPDLREIHFGIWEGLRIDEVQSKDPRTFETWVHNPGALRIPDAETFQEVQDRAAAALERWIALYPGKTLALVTHGGVISALLCRVLNEPIQRMWDYKLENTSVSHITRHASEGYRIGFVNDHSHLI
jgi:alpha-ribazole phosphatase